MNWDKFNQETRKLAEKIDFKPDIIVGIVRGGIVPAQLLSSLLDVKQMYCITVTKHGRERMVMNKILEDLNGKKVLLVEDVLETGKSLITAQEYLQSKEAIVKTACLYTLPSSQASPDYFLRKINKIINFPWE